MMIDLKAELFRKQEAYKKEKLQNASYIKGRVLEKKPNLWSKKNAGVLERAQRDLEAKTEEDNSLEKSRKVLAAKAKLYEKMTQGKDLPEEDGSKIFLVDFQKKVIDNIAEKREEMRRKQERKVEPEEDDHIQEDIPGPAQPDEEWTEYVDSLGRTRTCMKKDLPDLLKRDKLLNRTKIKPMEEVGEPQLMSGDMRRELERQQWENEELEALDQPAGPVHYSNVQFNEVRNHGVGYYQFSKEESMRQEEMGTLKDLRDQTVDQRARRERLKEKRKALLDSRLAKVKQRKQMREGGGVFSQASLKEDEEKEISLGETKEPDDVIGPKVEEKATEESTKEKEIETILQNLRKDSQKTNTVREWDIGKTEYLARTWEDRKQKLEDERPTEFAPPQIYYDDMARDDRLSHGRKKIQMPGKRGGFLNASEPKVEVYTLEQYAERARVTSSSTTDNSEQIDDIGAIPLPENTKPDFSYQQSNISEPSVQTISQHDAAFGNHLSPSLNNPLHTGYNPVLLASNSVPTSFYTPPLAFDPTIPPPPPMFDLSQPPPGFVPPPQNFPPPPSTPTGDKCVIENPPPKIHTQGTYDVGTHTPQSQVWGEGRERTTELYVGGSLTTGAGPKLPIMDTRNIKNKDASVLASLTQTTEPAETLTSSKSTTAQEPSANAFITGAPVRYKTEDTTP